MAFTHAHGVVRMKVSCAEPSAIPSKVDHTYAGVGYLLRFQVEGEDDGDALMDDVDPDNDSGRDDEEKDNKSDDDKKFDDKQPMVEKTSEQKRDTQTVSGATSGDQVNHQKAAPIQFGSVNFDALSLRKVEEKLVISVPRRRWSDRVEEDEDSLPSPLAASAPPKLCHASSHVQAEAAGSRAAAGDKEKAANVLVPVGADQSPMKSLVDAVARKFSWSQGFAVTPPASARSPSSSPVEASSPSGSPTVSVLCGSGQELSEQHDLPEADGSFTPSTPGGSTCGVVASAGLHTPRQEAMGVRSPMLAPSSPSADAPGGSVGRVPSPTSPRPGTGVFLGSRYAADEVIAYGGIPEANAKGVRSSARLRAQDNADETQMERAQKRAHMRDIPTSSGNTNGYSLDPYVVLPTVNGKARRSGYWVQPAGIGCTGFVQPVQLAF